MLRLRTAQWPTFAADGPARPQWTLQTPRRRCGTGSRHRLAPRPKHARTFTQASDLAWNAHIRFRWQGAKCPSPYSDSIGLEPAARHWALSPGGAAPPRSPEVT